MTFFSLFKTKILEIPVFWDFGNLKESQLLSKSIQNDFGMFEVEI